MEAGERIPGYVAILPSRVRYDPELTPNAKLLYAEITALADARGYCYCRNEYFSKLFGLAIKSVSRLVSQLAEKGYVSVEVIRDPETNIVTERRIWVDTPPRRKEGTPPPRIAEENDLSSFNDIPPISPKEKPKRERDLPQEVSELLRGYTADKPAELRDALEAFMEVRTRRKAVNTARAVKALLVELDKLAEGNDAVRLRLVSTAVLNGWKSVYPLKDKPASAGCVPGPVVEDTGVRAW